MAGALLDPRPACPPTPCAAPERRPLRPATSSPHTTTRRATHRGPHRLRVAVEDRVVQGRPAIAVPGVRVAPRPEDQGHELRQALARRHVEGRPAAAVGEVGLTARGSDPERPPAATRGSSCAAACQHQAGHQGLDRPHEAFHIVVVVPEPHREKEITQQTTRPPWTIRCHPRAHRKPQRPFRAPCTAAVRGVQPRSFLRQLPTLCHLHVL